MAENYWMLIALVAVVVVAFVAFFLGRKSSGSAVPDDEPRAAAPRPKKDLLETRDEVEAPVEIHEGMSLAEIKRAKSARVVGDKGRRETAKEATEKSRAEHAEVSEATEDDGWGEMLGDDAPDFSSSAEVSEAKADARPTADAKPAAAAQPKDDAKPKFKPAKTEDDLPTVSLSEGLAKTRKGFIGRLSELFKGETLDPNLVEEVEEILYTADIGPKAAADILGAIEAHLSGEDKNNPAKVWGFVRAHVESMLSKHERPIDFEAQKPFVILVVGVNGVGKTTTIGKLASKFHKQGKKVLMVAGDTFRAAAVEQLGVWGERTNIPVHQGEPDADPASVIFGGIERGVKEGMDVIICDTAGRLHTNVNLLEELKKIRRVASKVIDSAPHETFLVLDANTGQNAIQQARMFSEAVDVSGIVLTKLDGTAKGGVILGICEELEAPIRYIGVGEGVADLRQFNSREFVEALFM